MTKQVDVTITIKHDASIWGRVSPRYVSYTMDWWSNRHLSWENSSILNADLERLVEPAKGLSPSFLRIGGSQSDTIIYQVRGDESPCEKNHCLSMGRWEEVLKFAETVGAKIVFTLNYLSHTVREGKTDQRDWDYNNAKNFLNYTAQYAPEGLIHGFELGNELTHGGKATNITRMVRAYQDLRSLINQLWQPPRYIPKVVGPASTGAGDTKKLIKALGPYLDIVTYHKYHGVGKNKWLGKHAIQPNFQSHPGQYTDRSVTAYKYFYLQRNKTGEFWIGEGSMAYNSGRQNVTDSFVSSLWYANLLGALAKTEPMPHSVYCRQSLVGGNYDLVSHQTWEPNPDYWIARAWKELVGVGAVGPIVSARAHKFNMPRALTWGCCKQPMSNTLLVHAFCARPSGETKAGDLTFVMINLDGNNRFSVKIANVGETRSEYAITADGVKTTDPGTAALKARKIRINGKRMELMPDGTLPPLVPQKYSKGAPVVVQPYSVSFVVVHGVSLKACIDLYETAVDTPAQEDPDQIEGHPSLSLANISSTHLIQMDTPSHEDPDQIEGHPSLSLANITSTHLVQMYTAAHEDPDVIEGHPSLSLAYISSTHLIQLILGLVILMGIFFKAQGRRAARRPKVQ